MGIKKLAFAAATSASLGFGALAAGAQPPVQEGLVNVNLSEIDVAVPVAVAANICDVNVAVLVSDLLDDSAACTTDIDQQVTFADDGPGGANQRGLVNVNVSNVDLAVPVSVIANICDVNVAVLVRTLEDDATPCEGVTVQEIQ
jgi:hypothetical protein